MSPITSRHHCALRTITLTAAALAACSILAPAAEAHPDHGQQVRTFEHDPVNTVPPGCLTPAGAVPALVSDTTGYHSARSLHLVDQDATKLTRIQCPATARHGADFSFAVHPSQLAGGFQFTLLGHVQAISGDPQPVFQLNVTPQGSVRWYDASGWTQVAAPGTVALATWSTVRVQVPVDQHVAHVYVNGHYVGDGGPYGVRAVSDITGYQFSSAGTATTGDDVYVDDVAFGGPRGGPPRGAPDEFKVGVGHTIAESSTPVQMPNTAVNVYRDGHRETLVSYPAHTDASETAGNVLAVSTDGGTTWTPDNSRNPMPDAPSYGLTRLDNGDILAVDYHTYMTPDSGNLQAEVPTAISHDQGMTWTQRTGRMTTPEAMRNISSVTDRPGSPLGGFVLVHSVVEDHDGTLYQSAYGYYAGDIRYRQLVLVSHDEGANWIVRATVAVDPTIVTEGYCEGALARTADGSLLIVMRTGSYQTMYTSRSTDNGATWSAPAPLLAGRDAQPVVGIYPSLTLLPTGVLVLWVGRPGQSMLASPDGNGASWTRPQEIDYANSGNGATLLMDAHHLLVFGDRGANWSHPTPAPYRVWSRTVSVQIAPRGDR